MRGTKGVFERTGEISREVNKCSDWLEDFAEKLAIAESTSEARVKTASRTAVEVSRDRNIGPSVYEIMSSIVSARGPRYSSVEEAVKDYQEKTGLATHLERTAEEQMQNMASLVTAGYADDGEEHECPKREGKPCEICDASYEDEEDPKADGHGEVAEEDNDIEQFLDFLEGFEYPDSYERDSRGDSDNATGFDSELNSLVSEADGDPDECDKPEIVVKVPAIEHYIDNMIDTNHGIQLPALIHSLVETFNREGVDQSSCQEKDFMGWLNSKLIERNYKLDENIPSEIGRGVGLQIDYSNESDPNKDPFTLLEPQE